MKQAFSKAIVLALVMLMLTSANPAQPNTQVIDSDQFYRTAVNFPRAPDYSTQIDALLKRMSIEEKVGQMTQLTLEMIVTGHDQTVEIDQTKLDKAIRKYGVGSILNCYNQALPAEKWQKIITQIQTAAKSTRLGIPVIYGLDSIHGANYVQGATIFPQEIGMAATWNPQLMQRAAEISASETRAVGVPWSFSPVLDIGRQPLWSRFWETFGEDPYLAKVMGVAFVRGMEGTDLRSSKQVAVSLKHYVGYSFPLSGRDRTSAWIPENYLREYFLPTFAAAVQAGARTVMVNSGDVNGVPVHASSYLLKNVLRDELGFKGFVVSDWEDIKKLARTWRVAVDEKEATRMAVMAGVDMSMVPQDYSFADLLAQLVREGKVPQSRIDEAVRRILRVKFELGLFEDPMPKGGAFERIGLADSRQVSLQAAQESITLLKNANNLLPLAKSKKILVTGPTADSLISLNNAWTYVWQGSELSLYPKDRPTIRQAIETKAGAANITYVPGTKIMRRPHSPSNNTPTNIEEAVDIPAAVEAARDVDVVVLCLGEGSYCETPGSISDLTLGEPQLKLAEAIAQTGKPIVIVLVEGRPRVINRIVDSAAAILMAYNPGNEGGQAVADVLFGDVNPAGKLPFTYPRAVNALITYDHRAFETEAEHEAVRPQFEFGSGLSYTTFAYSNLTVGKRTINRADELPVSVTLKNTGARAGQEVVQLYISDLVASIAPAGRRLRRFMKISLGPGEERTVSFNLQQEDLSFVGASNRAVVEPGDFEVMIGGLKSRFTLQ